MKKKKELKELVIGVYQANEKGFGFVKPEDVEKDEIFIPYHKSQYCNRFRADVC